MVVINGTGTTFPKADPGVYTIFDDIDAGDELILTILSVTVKSSHVGTDDHKFEKELNEDIVLKIKYKWDGSSTRDDGIEFEDFPDTFWNEINQSEGTQKIQSITAKVKQIHRDGEPIKKFEGLNTENNIDTNTRRDLQKKKESPILEPGDFVYSTISWTQPSAERAYFNEHLGLLLGTKRFPIIEENLIHSPVDTTESYILVDEEMRDDVDRSNDRKVTPAPPLAEVFDQPTVDLLTQLGLDSVAAFLTADLSQVASQQVDTDKLRELRDTFLESINGSEVFTVSVDEVYRWAEINETAPGRN